MADLMPVIFFGHGNPMNAISKNKYSDAWGSIGTTLPRPKAILSVSAHWYIPSTRVTDGPAPRTIHDFGGFPEELYEKQYPAPGSPALARRIKELLSPAHVGLDETWGLDHGTWTVLANVFPKADIPVVQLSIDETQPPGFHYEMGRRLSVLREEEVLVVGSGNIVHNLHAYAWGDRSVRAYDWAMRFEQQVLELILKSDYARVVDYTKLGQDAMLSVPTPDHYLPLLYALGLRRKNEEVSFPVRGMDGGSVSMLAVRIG